MPKISGVCVGESLVGEGNEVAGECNESDKS
jgi:hypothetical protein